MHPIEHLRYLARSGVGVDSGILVSEAAQSLAACASDPPTLLTSARTLLRHQPGVGPLWWLSARILASMEPRKAAWASVEELRDGQTARAVADELPEGARICLVGEPAQTIGALRRRGDVSVIVIEVDGSGRFVEQDLTDAGIECETVEAHRLGSVVEYCDLVLVEPNAIGDATAVVGPGVIPAVATARLTHTPAWMVCGPGDRLPEPFVQAMIERVVMPAAVPWVAELETLNLGAVDQIVTSTGSMAADQPPAPTCPFTPELL